MNNLNYVSVDSETGGLVVGKNEVIEIAAQAYNGLTLEPFPVEMGGQFSSLMKPLNFDNLDQQALDVNGITREELEKAPDQAIVWRQFVDWLKKWNVSANKSKYGAPIAIGKNVRYFDIPFFKELCRLHCPKKEKTVMFHERIQLDLEDFIHHWFRESNELEDEKLDTLRDYFGISRVGAHRGLKDVLDTGTLVTKFLKMYQAILKHTKADGTPLLKLKGACAK